MPTTNPAGFRSLPLPIIQLSLATVLNCGQSFRWASHSLAASLAGENASLPTHEYRLCLRDRVVCLRQTPDTLLYRAVFPSEDLSPAETARREAETLAWVKEYFRLDVDLLKLYDDWSNRDPIFCSLRSRFSGIRVLRQDPWENLVCFICSSNNNIARITKMVHALCRNFSPQLLSLPLPYLPPDDTPSIASYHPFPPPSVLAAPGVAAKLRSLGFGYRAEFIQRTAKMLVDEHGSTEVAQGSLEAPERWLMTLRRAGTAAAREELLRFVGVGRKVADCVLLMSLDKPEVIPVDTHVQQIAVKHYGLPRPGGSTGKGKAAMTPKLYDQITSRLGDTWGEYAGWAHSILFTADLRVFSTHGMNVGDDSTQKTPENSTRVKRSHADIDHLAMIASPSCQASKEVTEMLAQLHKVKRSEYLAHKV